MVAFYASTQWNAEISFVVMNHWMRFVNDGVAAVAVLHGLLAVLSKDAMKSFATSGMDLSKFVETTVSEVKRRFSVAALSTSMLITFSWRVQWSWPALSWCSNEHPM